MPRSAISGTESNSIILKTSRWCFCRFLSQQAFLRRHNRIICCKVAPVKINSHFYPLLRWKLSTGESWTRKPFYSTGTERTTIAECVFVFLCRHGNSFCCRVQMLQRRCLAGLLGNWHSTKVCWKCATQTWWWFYCVFDLAAFTL